MTVDRLPDWGGRQVLRPARLAQPPIPAAAPVGCQCAVGDLTDVTLTLLQDGDGLYYDSGTATWLNAAANDHVHAASDIVSGVLDDGRISESSVVQHQAALTITESQISDLGNYSLVGHVHATSDITSGVFDDARISESSVTQHEAALSILKAQIPDFGGPYALESDLTTHTSSTTSVHGIADTSVLATDADIATHAAIDSAHHDPVTLAAGETALQLSVQELSLDQDQIDLSGDYLLLDTSNDPLTAGLEIEGSADEVQLIVKANATQTSNILEVQDSSSSILSGFDRRGIIFSHGGTDPTNVFIGGGSGNQIVTGSQNTALGSFAGASLTTGYRNFFAGNDAGRFTSTGANNFFMGLQAGYRNTSGNGNIFIGLYTGWVNNSTSNNTYLGYISGFQAQGTENVAIGANTFGRSASGTVTGLNYNTVIGASSGYHLTTNSIGNVHIGNEAGWNETGSNTLYIQNSLSNLPLVYGEFDDTLFRVNGHQEIIGNADTKQLVVKANATQTTNLLEVQNSGGTWLSGIDDEGFLTLLELSSPTADTDYGKIWPESDNNLYFQDGDGITHLLGGESEDETWAIIDGMAFDKPDMTIVDDSGLKLDIEKVGGGDIIFRVDGVDSTLDCTTGAGAGGTARVALTAGADANNPETNYIYITDAAGVATLNASGTLPTGAFAWVGKIIVPDATTWASTGAYGFQRYTEAFSNDSRGALSHEREKLRALGAVYISGVTQTLNITTNGGTPDNVHLATGSGSVYQLHRQSFPAFSTGPYYLGNTSATIYDEISDLNELLTDSLGSSMSGNAFNLVVWGAVNISSGECKLYVNLPNDSYNITSQAISDTNNTTDYTVPDDLRSVAFMISRIALSHSPAGGGTWTELGLYSLLGTPPGVRAGGAGAVAATEFTDSQFRVVDDGDATKEIAFEASSITTSTTRTLTVQDSDGTIELVGHTHAAADIVSGTLDDARIAQSNVTQHQAALSITESQISDLGSYSVVGHVHAAADITSGTFADALVAQSNVTQHQAALSITESQISDLGSYEDALGNPASDGYHLASTAAGVRSWVAPFGEDVDDLSTDSGSATNYLRVAAGGATLEYRTAANVLTDIAAAPTANPVFTGTVTLNGAYIQPQADSTTALQVKSNGGTWTLTNWDTTNLNHTHTGSEFSFEHFSSSSNSFRVVLKTNYKYAWLRSHDLGNDVPGPYIWVERNTNATNPGAGFLRLEAKGGTDYNLWVDNSGNFRIWTSYPIGSQDTSGTVIGTQTSLRETKDFIGSAPSPEEALNLLLSTIVYKFSYKKDRMEGNPDVHVGIVTDERPQFGMHNNQSFNPVSAFGYTVQAIKALEEKIRQLEEKLNGQ